MKNSNPQLIAAGIDGYNVWRDFTLAKELDKNRDHLLEAMKVQNSNFENALTHLAKMREFLTSPSTILGSEKTKHGEIAEHMEVNVRNAKALFDGIEPVASFKNVARTAPEDFILNGEKFQSKFLNGTGKSLNAVIEHYKVYPEHNMSYIIPKDQYETIEGIIKGINFEALNTKSMNSILRKVAEIEQLTGKSFEDAVRKSFSNYDEVQIGKVMDTLSKHQEQLTLKQQEKLSLIEDNYKDLESKVKSKYSASISDGLKATTIATATATFISASTQTYKKVKNGKALTDFDREDLKEIGIQSIKVGGKSGIIASSVYTLTNVTALSAPFAGAVTSASMGMTSLILDFNDGKIDSSELLEMGQVLCLDAGVAAIGTALGQTFIPIPVVGAIIGSVTTNFVWDIVKGKLGEHEAELKKVMDDYMAELTSKVDNAYFDLIEKIDAKYRKYNSLLEAAFDLQQNEATLAAASVDLAISIGVDKSKIIKNDDELWDYFTK